MKKKMPRAFNKKLKKEYYKGFMDGYQKYLKEFENYKAKIRELFGKNISQQLVDTVDAGMEVNVTLEVSGKALLEIIRESIQDSDDYPIDVEKIDE